MLRDFGSQEDIDEESSLLFTHDQPSHERKKQPWSSPRVSQITSYCFALHFCLAFIEIVQITPVLVLFERSICLQYYTSHDPSVIAPDGSIAEPLCKVAAVQRDLATTRGWKSSFDTIPGSWTYCAGGWRLTVMIALLVAIPVGRFGDRYGRQKAMGIGLLGILLSLSVVGIVCELKMSPHAVAW